MWACCKTLITAELIFFACHEARLKKRERKKAKVEAVKMMQGNFSLLFLIYHFVMLSFIQRASSYTISCPTQSCDLWDSVPTPSSFSH